MSDLIKDFGNYFSEKYVQDKGAETPVTESKSLGGGVSFEVVDGAIVTTYDSQSLASKAQVLSAMHQKNKAAYIAKQNNIGMRR